MTIVARLTYSILWAAAALAIAPFLLALVLGAQIARLYDWCELQAVFRGDRDAMARDYWRRR
ncbi:hypothetical protein [Paradevosia shaoguanensis]|uniref:Uncharacterized protein n=1 Tax=Paradevosia shaoguanensis TaxID=1335043 RepID=A0AA41QQD1_9HYPH|nr:hypothetical protein [Paradevosia shaoguanensis]KFL25079.1 hypothetical protein JP74_21350 [Devosia sp. 17-2-E-8]MCF1744608.1 hypothetical protein [Paradevosia shaoguanensis]MCI0129091.1 hypothetical protein [Paradevosia shaoguanensis]